MQVKCPECAASVDGEPGAEMVCPACMSPFLVPANDLIVRAFDVQLRDGRVLHGVHRHALREAIYAGRIDREARVRHDGGRWELIGGYREFATIFRVLGEDMGTLQGTRKLAGAPAAESRGPRSELSGPRSELPGPRSELPGPRSEAPPVGPRSEAPPVRGPLSEVPPSGERASTPRMPTLDLDTLTGARAAPMAAPAPTAVPTHPAPTAAPALAPAERADPPRRGPPSDLPFTGGAPRPRGPKTEEPRMSRPQTARPPVEGARPAIITQQPGTSKVAIAGLIAIVAGLAYLLLGG